MSDIKPNGEGERQLMVGGVTLSEFFSPQKMGYKITRQELVQVLAIYTTKADTHEAMKMLDFGLRRALRTMLREEKEALEAEEKKADSLIITP